MKIGKISESVLKRSVLKYMDSKSDDVIKGAGIGSDCAFLCWKQDCIGISSQTVSLPITEAAGYAVYAAINNLAAGGMYATAITATITLPQEAEEITLQEFMKQIRGICREYDIQLAGGHTEVTHAVTAPVITITALGKPLETVNAHMQKQIMPGQDIVMTKWIGLEGTSILAKEKEVQLLKRYPASLVRQAQGFEKYLPILPEAATALKSGVCAMHDVRNGGIFGALFELSRSTGVGLSVDLKQIPVKQETIEICEFFDINPYELLSGGCLLMVAEDGEVLTEALREAGIDAAVIGKMIPGNDKVVINGEETRFLEPAKPDEIYKVNFAP